LKWVIVAEEKILLEGILIRLTLKTVVDDLIMRGVL